MDYHFKIHKDKESGFFWAQCIELEGCLTQAETWATLVINMQDALHMYIQEQPNSEDIAVLPNKAIRCTRSIMKVPVNPEIAFSFLVRYWRLKYGWTQKQVAEQMGLETLFSYQRLEAGRCNPSLKTISMLKKVYPELSIDLALN